MRFIASILVDLLSVVFILSVINTYTSSNFTHEHRHSIESISANSHKQIKNTKNSREKRWNTSEKITVSNNEIPEEHIEAVVNTITEVNEDNNEVSVSTNEISVSTNGISENTGYIFVGDSRFVGMDIYCNIDEQQDKFLIAKVGEGYNYLITYAIPQISEIINSNTSFGQWKVIVGLGVNDLGNINKYVEAYNEINNGQFELVLVSVNPVEYHSYITNETIESFNNSLKAIENTKYIDTYQCLIDNGYSTSDGVHYTKSTYLTIYDIIIQNL